MRLFPLLGEQVAHLQLYQRELHNQARVGCWSCLYEISLREGDVHGCQGDKGMDSSMSSWNLTPGESQELHLLESHSLYDLCN